MAERGPLSSPPDGARATRLVATFDKVPDDHRDLALVVLGGVRLRRLAPAAVEQDVGGLHAHGRWVLWLPHDRRKNANAFVGIGPAQ
jgi:hypothetical protein